MNAKYLPRISHLVFIAAIAAAPILAQAQTFTLEGQSRDTSGANGSLPVGRGVGDGTWTAGSLSSWREGDWIPMRVNMAGGPFVNQQISVEVDHASGSVPGLAALFTFVATPNPVASSGFRPDQLPTSNLLDLARGFQASSGVTITFVSVAPTTVTDTTTTLTYTVNVTMTGATGQVTFMSRLSAGSHDFGGASLQVKGSPPMGVLKVFKPAAAPGSPDLSITKSGPTTAAPGATISYTLGYSNIAPGNASAGTGVQIVDSLPAGLTYVAGSASCPPASCAGVSVSGNQITWDLPNLLPGAPSASGSTGSQTFKAVVDPAAINGQTLVNSVHILSAEDDANTANNDATATTTVSVAATALAVDPASGTYGGTISSALSATLTVSGTSTPIAGQLIVFSFNGNAVCGGVGQPTCPSTNASGIATLSNIFLTSDGSSSGTPIAAGSYPTGVQANYAGVLGPPAHDAAVAVNSLTIDKATLVPGNGGPGTIKITGYSVIYDAASHTATGVATGISGEDLSSLLDLTNTAHTNAASYPTDAWSFAGDSNYNAANGTVADEIDPFTLVVGGNGPGTLNVTGYTVTYDAAPHTATGTANGLLGEDLSTLLDLSGTTHTNAANYPNDPWSFAGNSNYNSSNGTVVDVISKANLPVNPPPGSPGITIIGYSVVFDGNPHIATGSASGFSGEDLSPLLNLLGTTHTDAATYPADPWSFAGNANYNPNNGTVADAIAKGDLPHDPPPGSPGITVTAYNVGYDRQPHTATGTVRGFKGEDLGNLLNLSGTTHTNASSYPTDGWSFPGSSNYNSSSGTVADKITAHALAPSVTAANKTYDGTTSATITGRNLAGVVTGDTVSLAGGTAAFADPNAGSGKTVTADGLSLSGADAANYVLATTSATTTADISKADQTIAFPAIDNRVFNFDGPFTVSPTASSGLPVSVAVKSGPAGIDGSTVTVSALGKVTLTASQPGNNNYNAAPSADQSFFVVPPPALLNISTRGRVGTGDNVLIGGYIVKGEESKTFAARGIGPSIKSDALPQTVIDPLLELHGPDGTTLMKNDNWQDTQEADIQASGLAPTHALESAIIATTAPGNYTAIVRDKTNLNPDGSPSSTVNIGIGLVELYDLSQNAAAVLANISTRGVAGTGDDVLIGGFIVNGKLGAAKVIMRAIGPSLAAAGVTNLLPDPTLELRDPNGVLLASNDNWIDDPTQAAAIQDTTIPPGSPKEAAIVISLPPANYTFIVADKNGATGVALAEVYDLTN